jgi:hypothetical protein
MQKKFLHRNSIVAAMSYCPDAWPKLLTDLVTTDVVESTHVPFFEYPFTISADAIEQLILNVGDPELFKKTASNTSRGWARRDADYINITTPLEYADFPDEIKQKFSSMGIHEIHRARVLTLGPQGYILPHSDSSENTGMHTYLPLRETDSTLFRFSDCGTMLTQVGKAYGYDTNIPQHYVINASDDWRMVMVIRHNSIVSPTPLPLERVCPPIICAMDHADAGKTGATFDVDCEYDLSTDGNNVTVTADHWPVSIMVDGIWLRQETIHHYGKGSMTQDGKKSLTVEVSHPVAQWYIEKLQSFVLEKAGIDIKIN